MIRFFNVSKSTFKTYPLEYIQRRENHRRLFQIKSILQILFAQILKCIDRIRKDYVLDVSIYGLIL